MRASGFFTFSGKKYEFGSYNTLATLDWGRGVLPYHTKWYWASMNCFDRNGNVVAGQDKEDFIEVAGAFVRHIDEFAEKFYAYVDEICSRKVK